MPLPHSVDTAEDLHPPAPRTPATVGDRAGAAIVAQTPPCVRHAHIVGGGGLTEHGSHNIGYGDGARGGMMGHAPYGKHKITIAHHPERIVGVVHSRLVGIND